MSQQSKNQPAKSECILGCCTSLEADICLKDMCGVVQLAVGVFKSCLRCLLLQDEVETKKQKTDK